MIYTDTKVVRSVLRGLGTSVDLIGQQGGTYSGKTFGTMIGLMVHMDISKQKKRVRVIGQTMPHVRDGVLADFETINDGLGLIKKTTEAGRKFHIGNSTIKFQSIDKLGKAKGPKFDITFINECNYMDFTIAQQLMLRTEETVVLDWNPVSEFWFHNDVIKDPTKKILFKRSTYQDNPALSEKKKREIEGLKYIDEQLYRVYALGLTGNIKGLIFKKANIVPSFPEQTKKVGYGLDFGFTNDPTVLVKMGVLGGRIKGKEMIHETGLTNQDICKRLRELGVTKKDEIFADAAEPKSIAEIKREGFNIKAAKKGKDSVNFGIGLIKEHGIDITKDSVNWRKEKRNYKWKEKDGKPLNIPVDKFNHCWDAARYWSIMKLSAKSGGGAMKLVNRRNYPNTQQNRI